MNKKILMALLAIFSICNSGWLHGTDWKPVAQSKALIDLKIKYSTDLTVSTGEQVYVLDNGNFKVHKLDSNLNLIKSFGKRGEGPGEFSQAYSIGFDTKGTLWVTDSHKKFVAFNRDGVYLREFKMPPSCMVIKGYVLTYPVYAGTRMNRKKPGSGYFMTLFNLEEDKILGEYELLHQPNYGIRTSSGGIMSPSLKFLGGHSWVEVKRGRCLMAEGERLNVRLIDQTGKMLTQLTAEGKKKALNEQEIDYLVHEMYTILPRMFSKSKIRGLIENYEGKNPLHAIKLDRDCFYVFKTPEDISEGDRLSAEVYDFRGQKLGVIVFPKVPRVIHHGFAYWFDSDEEEENRFLFKFKIPDVTL